MKTSFDTWRARVISLAKDTVSYAAQDTTKTIDTDTAIRRHVSTVRRLDVVGVAGGVGCSHLAARLAMVLSHRRGGRILGVDAGHADTFTRLTQVINSPHRPTPVSHSDRLLHARPPANRAEEETASLLVGGAGLRVVRPDTIRGAAVRPQDWKTSVDPIARYFDVMLTDWGHRLPGIDFEKAGTGSHCVALVCRADRFAIEQACSVAAAVSMQRPCIVCAVDVDGIGSVAVNTARQWNIVPVCYQPFLMNPGLLVPPLQTRRALAELAAHMMLLATATEPNGDSQ